MAKNSKANKTVAESVDTATSASEQPEVLTGSRNENGWYVQRGKHERNVNADLFHARCPRYCPPGLYVGKDPESGEFVFLTESMTPLYKHSYASVADLVKVARAARELVSDPAHNNTRIYALLEAAELKALPELAEQRKAEIEAREAAKRQRKLGVKVKETKSGDKVFELTEERMNQYVDFCIRHPGSSLAAFLENLNAGELPNMPKPAPDPAEAAKPDGALKPAEIEAMRAAPQPKPAPDPAEAEAEAAHRAALAKATAERKAEAKAQAAH